MPYAPPPVSSLGRMLMRPGATDGHEENKSTETMVCLLTHCGLSGGSGRNWARATDLMLTFFLRNPSPPLSVSAIGINMTEQVYHTGQGHLGCPLSFHSIIVGPCDEFQRLGKAGWDSAPSNDWSGTLSSIKISGRGRRRRLDRWRWAFAASLRNLSELP